MHPKPLLVWEPSSSCNTQFLLKHKLCSLSPIDHLPLSSLLRKSENSKPQQALHANASKFSWDFFFFFFGVFSTEGRGAYVNK